MSSLTLSDEIKVVPTLTEIRMAYDLTRSAVALAQDVYISFYKGHTP